MPIYSLWLLSSLLSPKMSKAAVAEVSSMETCLQYMPYEILIEIFRRLPKDKLIEISRLCSRFRDVAGDARFWKDVYIRYVLPSNEAFAFEELYSEPWQVKVIDLFETKIKPPVSSRTDQVIKVFKLDLSSITANKVTMEAILATYQCTELYLDKNSIDFQGRIMGIAPETFSKQTALEVLSLCGVKNRHFDSMTETFFQLPCHLWLAPVLSNCKNLKALNLSYMNLTNLDMLGFVKNLPTSLEKLMIQDAFPEDSFFELLAESSPNLKELGLCPTSVKCQSLLKFTFLEALYVSSYDYQDISDLYVYIKKFPALKRVHIIFYSAIEDSLNTQFEKLRDTLETDGIIVEQIEYSDDEEPYPEDCNLWVVLKTV